MHLATLIMDINIAQNDITDNFYLDHKAVLSSQTEYIFNFFMNKLAKHPPSAGFPSPSGHRLWGACGTPLRAAIKKNWGASFRGRL